MSSWLVRITVNPACTRLFTQGLVDGHEWHRDLMRLLPDNGGEHTRSEHGLLFRVESTGRLVVLAQLTTPPRTEALAADFVEQVQQRQLDPLLEHLRPNMRVRYRIDANPTKRLGNTVDDPGKKGKLAVLRGPEAEQWWLRRATEAGLQPLQGTATPKDDILGRPAPGHSRKKGTRAARHGVTRFEGLAVVTEPQQVREAVLSGIGRARSYGCGLLSLGPERQAA